MSLEFVVFGQNWTESERGWGKRPDGYTLHLTKEDNENYIREYWAGMPNSIPDEYSFPDGVPVSVFVSQEAYNQLQKSRGEGYFGIWGAMNGYIPNDILASTTKPKVMSRRQGIMNA